VAWALSSLEHDSRPLQDFLPLVQSRARPIQEMGGPSLSIMLWACAKARLRSVYMLPLYSVSSSLPELVTSAPRVQNSQPLV